MQQLFIGTSGFSFKSWRGVFYPPGLPERAFLTHYASRLGSVELNNTFYRMPTGAALAKWRSEVPETFRFALKAPRRITHLQRLVNSEAELDTLLERVRELGASLGVVLFQLPPNLKQDVPRLSAFLDVLGGRVPAAFEFRHASWFSDETVALLAERQVALVIGEPERDEQEAPFVSTAPHAYVRLRKDSYTDEELVAWSTRLGQLAAERLYVFFKHEVQGPAYAARLAELVSKAR